MGFLDAISARVDDAFQQVKQSLASAVKEAYDGVQSAVGAVTSEVQEQVNAARAIAARQVVLREVAALTKRMEMAAVSAVHRGFNEGQLEVFKRQAEDDPETKLGKRWRTTSETPCPACKALDGTVVGLDEEFESGSATPFFDLMNPPRHPNCRCYSETVSL